MVHVVAVKIGYGTELIGQGDCHDCLDFVLEVGQMGL
jgi:hypothetical protein